MSYPNNVVPFPGKTQRKALEAVPPNDDYPPDVAASVAQANCYAMLREALHAVEALQGQLEDAIQYLEESLNEESLG